jgi:hypothetical protein
MVKDFDNLALKGATLVERTMDVQSAIRAHKEWKDKFHVAMCRKAQFDLQEVAAADCCLFGKWLAQEGKARFEGLSHYAHCVQVHSVFHQEASVIAGLINQGDFIEAERLLAYNSPYSTVSRELTGTMARMFQEESGDVE